MEAHLNAEKLRKITLERVAKFLSTTEWTDINLTSRIYPPSGINSVQLSVWSAPFSGPTQTDSVSFQNMLQQPESAFRPADIGETFGPEWSTHWFKGMLPFFHKRYVKLNFIVIVPCIDA